MKKNYNKILQYYSFFVFFLTFSFTVHSQCAGDDAVFTVCDIPNPSSQAVNLFSLLGGSPVSGGVWEDVDGSGGLNSATGILNAQLIRESNVYRYNYTVTGVGGCTDTTSTVTVTIGGYSGVTSPNVSVCSDVVYYNLFQPFNGNYVSPQSNGVWHNDTTNQYLSGSTVYVENLEGIYQFTYTMPAIGTCPAMSSTAVVRIFRAPESGNPAHLDLCATDGLTAYTNLDLFSRISNYDLGGVWRDNTGTGELTFTGDHNINLEKIYNTYGEGTYHFTYEVPSNNPICTIARTTVRIRLERKLDFTGAILEVNSDICESEITTANYSATIKRGPDPIPNGLYYVTFSVSGPRAATETVVANFTNGTLLFPIKPEYFQTVGRFRVNILNIVAVTSVRACQNTISNLTDELIIYPLPDLTGAVMTPATVCQNQDALVQITNAVKLADGDYDIIYNISGANTATAQVSRLTVTGGIANFTIPEILNSRSGTSTITITAITHVISQCVNSANLKGEILVNPLPNINSLRIQAPNVCFGEEIRATVSGLNNLTEVTLSYELSGANTSTVQTVVLTNTNGNAAFVIPSTLLPNTGTSTIVVTNLKNNLTNCDVDVTNVSDPFILNPIPPAPLAANQAFCKSDDPTVADLEPKGAQYKWYISETAATPLANDYVLKSENYYLKETSPAGCVSPASMISVTINDTPAPTLKDDGQNFCGLDNPTILNLSNNTNSPATVVWYDAPNGGNLISSGTLLIDKKTYYGFDFSNASGCFSDQNLEVTVTLKDCNAPEYPFFIPDGFSPNGDGVNDVFIIPDIDFLYPDYTIEIFNRYGNGMYKGGKDKPGWDGINYESKGISSGIAPNGVYFYIIQFNKDNKPPKQGRLYLNR
ncbi:gliding motility-associated C-terminal domain-containing protein [Flavobacterium hungaricum]|uniref:Gliding motility-associated C-terminal domain-containing protein n=1 Tax=Flavobacterium hungaricum TaxID=2082725 RepID=A0ABR9TE98_9FLAO|nr:gliding motility-associated C-terminal domain-containing protein [Flavobacterium hungaricum]MBE8723663.1 gliding motility-associated C-terminal domain-containing protein [Flavobacterium hungaricum]